MASGVRRLGKETHTQIDDRGCFNTHAHYYTDRTCVHMKTHGHTRTYIYGHTEIPTDSYIMKRHSFLGMPIC